MLERLFIITYTIARWNFNQFNRFQSAYRRAHSTETTLLRMLNDVYDTADNQSRSLVMQLHLSAAFDTLVKKTASSAGSQLWRTRYNSQVDELLPGRAKSVCHGRRSHFWAGSVWIRHPARQCIDLCYSLFIPRQSPTSSLSLSMLIMPSTPMTLSYI